MKIFIAVLLLLSAVGSVWAGNVKHFAPDAPLIEAPEGLFTKVEDLCKRSDADIGGYFDNDFEYQKFLQQFDDTKNAVQRNGQLTFEEKRELKTNLLNCQRTVKTRMVEIQRMSQQLERTRQAMDRPEKKQKEGDPVSVSNISTIVIKLSYGYTTFSVKADVRNNTKISGNVLVTLQGLDGNGYEVTTEYIKGFLDADKTTTLSGQGYIASNIFSRISQWKIMSIR